MPSLAVKCPGGMGQTDRQPAVTHVGVFNIFYEYRN